MLVPLTSSLPNRSAHLRLPFHTFFGYKRRVKTVISSFLICERHDTCVWRWLFETVFSSLHERPEPETPLNQSTEENQQKSFTSTMYYQRHFKVKKKKFSNWIRVFFYKVPSTFPCVLHCFITPSTHSPQHDNAMSHTMNMLILHFVEII